MAIRWRKDGRLLCAAMHDEEPGDLYIHDEFHYRLSVIAEVIVADDAHTENGLWHWVRQPVPVGVSGGEPFYKDWNAQPCRLPCCWAENREDERDR